MYLFHLGVYFETFAMPNKHINPPQLSFAAAPLHMVSENRQIQVKLCKSFQGSSEPVGVSY